MFLPCDRCGLSLHRMLIHQGSKLKSNIAYVEIKVRCPPAVPSISYLASSLQEEMDFGTPFHDGHREQSDTQEASLTFFSCSPHYHIRPVTLCGHSLCWVCAPVRESLCLLWCETHTNGETGSGGEKEGPREDRGSVDKGRQREAVDNGGQRRTIG